MLNEDYREMLQILLGNDVHFLVVGAYAMGAYGFPRATGDLVLPSPIFQTKHLKKKVSYSKLG